MKLRAIVLLLLGLLALLAACQRTEEFDGIAAATFGPAFNQSQVVTLGELAESPAAYLDRTIQISGIYHPNDDPICVGSRSRSGPASWSLESEGWIAEMGGFDEQVTDLFPEGLAVTAEGTWRFWSGLLGCGKQAEMTEIWYLEVSDILSPNPLVRVTLTPSGVAAAEETAVATVGPTLEASPPAAAPNASPTFPASPTPLPLATVAPPATISVTATPPLTGTLSGTATLTTTASTVTATAIATGSTTPAPGETLTVTATATETPTATPAGTPGVSEQGGVPFHSLTVESLDAGIEHSYWFTITGSTVITVGLVMAPDFDPVLKIVDEGGTTIVDQNNAGAGAVERVESLTLNDGESYQLIVREKDGRAAGYSFTIDDGDGANTLFFVAPLAYDETKNTLMRTDQIDFWHFFGEEGDVVTISIRPNDESDVLFLLLTPLLVDMTDDYIDDRPSGQPEQATFTLPETGLYTIWVEEWTLSGSDYLVTLTES